MYTVKLTCVLNWCLVELPTMILGLLSPYRGCMSKSIVADVLPGLVSRCHSRKWGFPKLSLLDRSAATRQLMTG